MLYIQMDALLTKVLAPFRGIERLAGHARHLPDELFAVHHDPVLVVLESRRREGLGEDLPAVVVRSLVPHRVQVDQGQRPLVPRALDAL